MISGSVAMENNQYLVLMWDSKPPQKRFLWCMWTVCKGIFFSNGTWGYCHKQTHPLSLYHINSDKLKSGYSCIWWDLNFWKFKMRFPKYQNFSRINYHITVICHTLTKKVETGILEDLQKFSEASKQTTSVDFRSHFNTRLHKDWFQLLIRMMSQGLAKYTDLAPPRVF